MSLCDLCFLIRQEMRQDREGGTRTCFLCGQVIDGGPPKVRERKIRGLDKDYAMYGDAGKRHEAWRQEQIAKGVRLYSREERIDARKARRKRHKWTLS